MKNQYPCEVRAIGGNLHATLKELYFVFVDGVSVEEGFCVQVEFEAVCDRLTISLSISKTPVRPRVEIFRIESLQRLMCFFGLRKDPTTHRSTSQNRIEAPYQKTLIIIPANT